MHNIIIDIIAVVSGNIFNLALTALFTARIRSRENGEYAFGIISMLTAIPLLLVSIANLAGMREWWTYVLPIPLIIFSVLELILDYILRLNFRETKLLIPYLFCLYLGQWWLVGYSFLVDRSLGFFTLGTYAVALAATWLAHRKPKVLQA
ncbi:MAG: hypothetical protein V1799_10585 [bacterium]